MKCMTTRKALKKARRCLEQGAWNSVPGLACLPLSEKSVGTRVVGGGWCRVHGRVPRNKRAIKLTVDVASSMRAWIYWGYLDASRLGYRYHRLDSGMQ